MTTLTPTQDVVARAMSEKRLQALVMDALKKLGWELSYHTWRSVHSPKGYPDIVAIKGSRGIAIELKRERAPLRPEQHAWLEGFLSTGWEAYCWRPSDWLSGRIEQVLTGERAIARKG